MGKTYSIKEQYNYHCKQSKKGAKNKKGQKLSNFARGAHLGKAQQISSNAKLFNIKKNKKEFTQRKYSKDEIDNLYDDLRTLKWK